MHDKGVLASSLADYGSHLFGRADVAAPNQPHRRVLELHQRGLRHPLRRVARGIRNYKDRQHGTWTWVSCSASMVIAQFQ